jgi:hypothetical protein
VGCSPKRQTSWKRLGAGKTAGQGSGRGTPVREQRAEAPRVKGRDGDASGAGTPKKGIERGDGDLKGDEQGKEQDREQQGKVKVNAVQGVKSLKGRWGFGWGR